MGLGRVKLSQGTLILFFKSHTLLFFQFEHRLAASKTTIPTALATTLPPQTPSTLLLPMAFKYYGACLMDFACRYIEYRLV